jgi:flagellar biosynthetic protein FliR
MSTALLVTMGLVASRIGGVFMIMPAFNARGVPKMTRVLCILALTSIVAPMVPLAPVTPTLGLLVFAIATEVLVGVIIGGVVTFIFGSLALANEFVTNQIGHGAAQLFDPMLKVSHGPISTLSSLLAAGVFIGTNLHLVLLINVADTFYVVPPGTVVNPIGGGRWWIQVVGEMLQASLAMAGPVLALVFLIHCFVAVLTKLAPQMNIFFSLGMILTMVAGLWMCIIIMPQQFETHFALVSQAVERVPLVLAEMDVR